MIEMNEDSMKQEKSMGFIVRLRFKLSFKKYLCHPGKAIFDQLHRSCLMMGRDLGSDRNYHYKGTG